MKKCCSCKIYKSLDKFHLDCTLKDGKQDTCIECRKSKYKKKIDWLKIHDGEKYKSLKLKSKLNYDLYYSRNKKDVLQRNKRYTENNKKLWVQSGLVPIESKCAICDKIIFYNCKDTKQAIHFDHRHPNTSISMCPAQFLQSRRPTVHNQLLWKQADFGHLCLSCNIKLPTNNRLQWVSRVADYVRGV